MRFIVAFFVLLAVVHCNSNGDQVLRIHAQSGKEVSLLKQLRGNVKLDFWTRSVSPELPVDVRVPHASLFAVKDFLRTRQIPFTVMISNVQELLDKEKAEMNRNAELEQMTKSFNFAAYHDLETIDRFMDDLVASHPDLISKVLIGHSYEGRSMYVLKFSTGGVERPAIWVDAGMHAREWVSHASAVWIANKIAVDYTENRAPMPSILRQMDIFLMIVANPDGYVFSHTSSRPFHRFWRKNRSTTSNPSCPGVDLNRNWDVEFGGPGAGDDPCDEDYRGPSPHSEVEVQNIANFLTNHGNFKSFMTLHSYSQLLMYPYGYSSKKAPNQPELHDVANNANRALNSWHGTVYRVGSICNTIEQASGASVDWAYERGIKYSFAFELRDTGEYGFLLPADQIVSTARETWLAVRYIMQYVSEHLY